MKGTLAAGDVRSAVHGERPLRKLFSKEQRAFYEEHAGGIDLDGLSVLGPIFVLKLRLTPEELGRRLVAELWIYPDGSRILELSTRCETNEAFQVAAELRSFLGSRDIEVSGDQETKTRKALEFFAEALRPRREPDRPPVGVADVRRRLRRGRRAVRRHVARACTGERRDVPALDRGATRR